MKLIYSSVKDNQYASESMKNKYIYMKRSNKEMDIHYIFSIENVILSNPAEFKTTRQYYFCIPFMKERHCYCYESNDNIVLNYNDILYELSYDEWLDTFRSFVENEGKLVCELPDKVIKYNNAN